MNAPNKIEVKPEIRLAKEKSFFIITFMRPGAQHTRKSGEKNGIKTSEKMDMTREQLQKSI